jgi:hypothetical protein
MSVEVVFMTLLPAVLLEQSAMVLLLEMDLVTWLLAKDEHGEHKDLYGSGHRSVIPYVHRRRELLYYSNLVLPVYA